MTQITPLPEALRTRYATWAGKDRNGHGDLHQRLADKGQTPRAMIISCCDSRVNPTEVFGSDPGEYFIHRNIANFVPASGSGDIASGTGAAVQFAVTALKVSEIVVMAHSACGGVAGCQAMCAGNAPELEDPSNLLGQWVAQLRPAYDGLEDKGDTTAMERGAALLSLENLMTFDFVASAVKAGTLTLHAAWIDIASGELMEYDAEAGDFKPV